MRNVKDENLSKLTAVSIDANNLVASSMSVSNLSINALTLTDLTATNLTTATLTSTLSPFIFDSTAKKVVFTDGTSTALLDNVVDSATLRIVSGNGGVLGDIGQVEYQGFPAFVQLGIAGPPEAPLAQPQYGILGHVVWAGYDGVSSVRSGSIRAQATQNWSPTEHGTGVILSTTKGTTDFPVLTAWEDTVKISDEHVTIVPNSSAILELESTTKALILPRMTAVQMNTISGPVPGMMVYNTDDERFWGYSTSLGWHGMAWV